MLESSQCLRVLKKTLQISDYYSYDNNKAGQVKDSTAY